MSDERARTPKVLVSMVGWNSRRYLGHSLQSILEQTFRDFLVLFVDNGSQDGSSAFVHATFPTVRILRNNRNLGFSRAHNQALRIQPATYALIANPDIILTDTFLETLVSFADAHPRSGSFGGKVKRFSFTPDELNDVLYSDTVDTTGLRGLASRRVIDRGFGAPDHGQYDRSEEVFGVSGALALYRRAALEDVRCRDEYFDEDFFLYKEDVDLAWRLRLRGWTAQYVPTAVAYHHREAQGERGPSLRALRDNRKKKRRLINYYSYKNHLHLLVKNEFGVNLLRSFLPIAWYELRKLVYILFVEPVTVRAIIAFWREVPRMIEKRRMIARSRTASAADLRHWFR